MSLRPAASRTIIPVRRATVLTNVIACCLTRGCIPFLSTNCERTGIWDPRCAERYHLHTRPSLKHVIGKGGATLARLEDLAQCLISIQDCGEHVAMVNFCGDRSGLGRFLVSALVHGHFSVLSTVQRNGVSPVELGSSIP